MKSVIQRPGSGLYISFEGIEGVGKSHSIRNLLKNASTQPDLASRITTATEITREGFGKDIINFLERHDDLFFRCGYPLSEAMVFFGMKLYELVRTILPALKSGYIVIEDRSVDSNCAYAAVQLAEQLDSPANEIYEKLLDARSHMAFIPDHTLLLIDDLEDCLERAQKKDGRTYSESEKKLVADVYDLYKIRAERNPERIHAVIFTGVPLEQRSEIIWKSFIEICNYAGLLLGGHQ